MHNHADWCTTTLMEKNITRLGCTEYTIVHIGERNGAAHLVEEEEGNCNCKETMETHCTLLHIVAEENHTPALIGSTKYTMVVHIGERLT